MEIWDRIRGPKAPPKHEKADAKDTLLNVQSAEQQDARDEFMRQLRRLQRAMESKTHGNDTTSPGRSGST